MSCWHWELGSPGRLSLSAVNKSHTEGLQSVKLLALLTQTADMWCPQNKLPINWVKLCWETTAPPLPALLIHLTSVPAPCLKFEWCQDSKYKITRRSRMKNWVNIALWVNLEQTQGEIQSGDPLVVSTGSSLSPHLWEHLGSIWHQWHFPQRWMCWKFCFKNQHKIFFLDTLLKGPNCDILQAPKRGPLERLCLSIWGDYSCSPSSKQLPNTMCFSSVLIKS